MLRLNIDFIWSVVCFLTGEYGPSSRGGSNIGVDGLDGVAIVGLEQLGSLGLGELELLDLFILRQ